ncbi:MAG: hypothetical protein QM756_30745 [Polyangiaceae bacterium]
MAPSTAASAGPAALPVVSRVSSKGYRCTQVVGLAVTAEWFEAGFEEVAGNDRWQALLRPHTFVRDWADPGSVAWSEPLRSPCSEASAAPERVLFFAADWGYKNENDWITGLTSAVNALRARYPGAKEISLLSMVRAPQNQSCGDVKGVVEPFVDSAMARISAQFDGLVKVGPKFEVPSCAAFDQKGGPHFSSEGRKQVARMIADYYAAEP